MSTTIETQTYIAAETIPELAEARQAARLEAEEILATRRQQIQSGQHEGMPLAVDALSTARRVQAVALVYGVDSPQYEEVHGGLVLDCHRLLAEWRRKNTSEYFPLIKHSFDEEAGSYMSHGMPIWSMTEDALTPSRHQEETERRVNERVEEATAMKIRALGGLALGGPTRMRTISECADWAIVAMKEDENTGYGGYVPEIRKLMVRDMIIDPETGDRFEEQIGLPGDYETHEILQKALARRNVDAGQLDKTELHGTQLLVEDDLIDFLELVDTVAGEEWCVNIFKGEVVPDDHPKDYGAIRSEAIARQEVLRAQARMTADFVLSLQQAGTDPEKAPEIVEEFVKRGLLVTARDNTAIAAEMFDEQTAIGLRQVVSLQARGQDIEALTLFNQVVEAAPGGGYCGAGSCGLKQADYNSPEAEALKEMGFDVSSTLLDKGGRKCPNPKCRTGTIAYEQGKKMKGCTNCKATAKY